MKRKKKRSRSRSSLICSWFCLAEKRGIPLTFLIDVALYIFEDARHPNFMEGRVTCMGTKHPILLRWVFFIFYLFFSKYKQNRRITNGIFLPINPNKIKMLPNMRLVGAYLTRWPGAHDYLHFSKLFQHMKKF